MTHDKCSEGKPRNDESTEQSPLHRSTQWPAYELTNEWTIDLQFPLCSSLCFSVPLNKESFHVKSITRLPKYFQDVHQQVLPSISPKRFTLVSIRGRTKTFPQLWTPSADCLRALPCWTLSDPSPVCHLCFGPLVRIRVWTSRRLREMVCFWENSCRN